MKTEGTFAKVCGVAWLVFGLVIACVGQPITKPGWFNAGGFAVSTGETNITFGEPLDPWGSEPTLLWPQESPSPIAEEITPEIEALARGLENDPKRIYDWVHDHIRHVLYFGSKKGAQLTLLERSGNDFDQCALLVALLRAAGYSPKYQFSFMLLPVDSEDHKDLKHWLQLSLVNTNWVETEAYFNALCFIRGYPHLVLGSDNNHFGLTRVWVRLPVGGTNYILDPAFKVHERVSGIDLATAMGLNTNSLWTAAAGTLTANYVTNLNEAALATELTKCTTNLLGTLRGNYPNASVEEILGGWRIVSSRGTELSQSHAFPIGIDGVEWTYLPTNWMSKLTVSMGAASKQWFMPQLQGKRLSLTFSSAGEGQLRLDDEVAWTQQTSGSAAKTNVVLRVDHPHGTWDFNNNTVIDTGLNDQTVTNSYQRTNASYALIYSFETSPDALRYRQAQLDSYWERGLGESSREIVTETLNVMGMNWLLQTEQAEQALNKQLSCLNQFHHRMGRMAQESGKGYYVDIYMQVSAIAPTEGGAHGASQRTKYLHVAANMLSALEHGIIEQLQSSNLVAASTVKMLQLANTNRQAIYLAASNNWSAVRGQLLNYDLTALDGYIAQGSTLLLPRNGSNQLAGAGSWAGYGMIKQITFGTNGSVEMTMLISGDFHGGYVSFPSVSIDPPFIYQYNYSQPTAFDVASPYLRFTPGADPVNMADGSFTVNETDLTVGRQAEPRGLNLSRTYTTTRRRHNLAAMATGWTHNYYFKLAEISAPMASLGETTPAQMAPMIVATRAAAELYRTQPDAKTWTMTALIAKWAVDQLINKGVSVTLGDDTVQFVKQPDGSYTPPANCTMTLLKTNSAYWLQERHGNTFKFSSAGRLTNIVDQYSQPLTLTYDSSNRVATAKDWKNRTLTFSYSGTPQRLASISDGSRTVSYGYSTTYSPQGDLTAVTDAEGKTHTFVYDTNHQITATINALNQLITSNVYDGFGRVVTQYTEGDAEKRTWNLFWSDYENIEEDPAGGRRYFLYDEKRRLVAQQDALSNVSLTFYDGQDHVIKTVSPMNETNRFEFDARHNLLRSIDPLNFTNQFFYDSQDRLTHSVDGRGNSSRFGYNAQHSLTGSTNGANDWVTFGYSSTGLLTNRADAGGSTAFGHDANGHVSRITYPTGLGSEGFFNNSFGDVLSRTNARGFVTSFQYNNRRELTNAIAPTNLTAKVAFDAAGNVQKTTDPRGFSTSNSWSATRKLLSTTFPTTPQGVPVIKNEYDSRDWLARTVNPLQHATTYTNDVAGRLTAATDPLQRTTRFGYDPNGRQTAITNAANEVTRQTWNKRGELTQVTDNANRTVKHAYDAAGNQITLTNRNGKKWQFQFDGANRLTNTITPLGRSTSQSYNNRGLLSSAKEPSGETTTMSYDPRGRLTNRVDALASTRLGYDANNNVTNVVESGKTNAWTYDAYDRVSTYRDADGNLIQYRHDANGNLTNLIYSGNKSVFYAYDSLNRLTNVTDWSQRKTSFEYDLASRLKKIVRPNGSVREIGYDAVGQTTSIVEKLTNNFPIAFFRFNWNAASRAEWEFAAPLPHSYTPPTRTMTYNDDNQIAMFNGNAVTHDTDGNMTSGPLTNDTFATYAYDARNRLLAVGGLQYGYDALGNRTAITNGVNVARFVVNPNAPLSQVLMRVKGGVTNYYIHGVGLLYEVTETASTTNMAFYHYDYRGSTVALTDGNGLPTDRIEYSAYGTTTYRVGNTDTPFLFNGRYGVQTDANGLLYMRARYYNPHLCRFLNADPIGFGGGLNFYAFADGNPVSMIDPFGLGADSLTGSSSWLDRAYSSIGNALMGPVDYGSGSISFNQGDFGSGADSYFGAIQQEATRRAVGEFAVMAAVSMIPVGRVGELLVGGERGAAAFGAARGLATGADEAVFWSGIGRGGANSAATWAAQRGGSTLESTLASKGMTLPAWNASNPASVAAWRQASMEFAAGARGNVRVLQGDALRVDAIWHDEFRVLQANPNVNSIRAINPNSGAEVLLWSR